MNLGKPLEGEYKCVLNPNTAMKEMYALFSKNLVILIKYFLWMVL